MCNDTVSRYYSSSDEPVRGHSQSTVSLCTIIFISGSCLILVLTTTIPSRPLQPDLKNVVKDYQGPTILPEKMRFENTRKINILSIVRFLNFAVIMTEICVGT